MLNKTMTVISFLACVLFVQHGTAQILNHDTKITVKVIGEDQEPVSNALVKIAFGQERQLGKAIQIEGQSDSNGLFSAEHGSDGHVFWSAAKEGYYSSAGYDFLFNSALVESGRWQPWNQVFDVKLYEIINPKPMYLRHIETKIPLDNENVGFDMVQGDWVTPYGKGEIPDLFFRYSKSFHDPKDFEYHLEVTFTNNGDGIQKSLRDLSNKSEFSPPRYAPENDYTNTWVKEAGRKLGAGYYGLNDKDRIFFLYRIRTVTNHEGVIVKALYGKIAGDFQIAGWGAEQADLLFTYYLNPDGTRNLEYSGENLFKDDGRKYPP